MSETPTTPSHEPSDVSLRGTLWFGLGLALTVVILGVLVGWMMAHMDRSQSPWPHQPTVQEPQFHPPTPVLQTVVTEDLNAFRASEDQALKSYGWIDKKGGVVRIPVERARELLLQRGLPQTGTSMPLPGPHPLPGQAPVNPPVQAPVPTTKGGAP